MKYILIIAAVILSLTGYAQLPETVRGQGNLIAKDTNLHIPRLLTIPSDTLSGAPINSIAIKNGVLYIKNVLLWEPISSGLQINTTEAVYHFQDSTNTPPVSFPVGTDTVYYMVGGAGTGIFSGHNYEVAMYVNEVFDSFIMPALNDWGLVLTGVAQNTWHQYDGSTWPRRNRGPWSPDGNYGGGILGSLNSSQVYLRYNNLPRIRLGPSGTFFSELTGTNNAIATLTAAGLIQRREPVASSDTIPNKPLAQAADGTIYRMDHWPGGGGGGGSVNVYAPLVKYGDTVSNRFNVLHYGAKGDGVTDDTKAIQNATIASVAAGVGVVYFPYTGNDYIVADSLRTVDGLGNAVDTAQLYIPYASWSDTSKMHVIFRGETAPNEFTSRGQLNQVKSGVVIRSTLNSATGGSVFGNAWTTTLGITLNFNEVTFENLNIKVRSKTSGGADTVPTMKALGLAHSGMANIKNCVINTESAMADGLEPATTAIGIEFPPLGNWTRLTVENTTIDNFYTGLRASEHTFTKNLFIATCYNAIELYAGYHSSSFQKTLIAWCVNAIYISGQCYFNFDNLDIEDYSLISGNPSKWYLPNLDIYEPSTTSSLGLINYQHVTSNVGVDNNNFTVSGTLSPGIKYRTVNDFYATLGVNTNSPQKQLHVVGALGSVASFPTLGTHDQVVIENNGNSSLSFIGATNGVSAIKFNESGGVAQRGTIQYDYSTEQFDFYTNAGATSRFSISSAGNVATSTGTIFNAGAGKIYLDAAGLVGINTATPVRQLHVIGAGTPTDPVSLGAADYIYLESTGNASIGINTGTSSIGGIKFYENGQSGGPKGAIFYDQSTDQMRFATNATDAATTSNLVITSGGDVGINTGTTANSKLQVSGSISPGAYRSITAGRTLDGTDYLIDYSGAGGHTVTLPTAVGITSRRYVIVNSSTSYLAMATTSSQTINGFTTTTIAPGNTLIVSSDNANWKVEAKSGDNNSRVSTQFDATSTTTLANITGLTGNVTAGKTYRFEAKLYTTSDVAAGVKAAIAGTATATNIIYEGLTTNAGTITQGRGTALATAVGAVTAVTAAYITISGTITVNAAGTLTVQFAQNASNATPSSVLVGSTFVITEIL